MSKPSGSKRPDGGQRPKTRQQQQQSINVFIYSRMDVMQKQSDAYGKALMEMAQKVELVSKLAQQMIVALVILNEKGLITNVEIAERQKQLMLPVDEQLAGLEDEVSRRAKEAGGGEGEAVEGQSKTAREAVSSETDSDDSTGDTESGEVQPKDTGTVECDGGRGPKLSDNKSEGGDRPVSDLQINGKSAGTPRVPESTDSGNKTPYLSLD